MGILVHTSNFLPQQHKALSFNLVDLKQLVDTGPRDFVHPLNQVVAHFLTYTEKVVVMHTLQGHIE